MGVTYGILFAVMGLLLLHPTIGLANTVANPYRPLGWISYGTQCIITSDPLPSRETHFASLSVPGMCPIPYLSYHRVLRVDGCAVLLGAGELFCRHQIREEELRLYRRRSIALERVFDLVHD